MSEQVSCPSCDQPVDVGEIECPHCRSDLSTLLAGEESEGTMDDVFSVGEAATPPPPQSADAPQFEATAEAPDADDVSVTDSDSFESDPDNAADSNPDISKSPPPETVPPIPAAAPPTVAVGATESDDAAGDGQSVARVVSTPAAATLVLEVEGHEEVIFRGEKVRRIETNSAELQIGRRDPANAIYPDIDLREFHRQQVGFVSRQHAQIIADRGRHFVEDLGGQETTQLASADGEGFETVPKNERRELTPGSRIMIGEAVVFKVLDPQGG